MRWSLGTCVSRIYPPIRVTKKRRMVAHTGIRWKNRIMEGTRIKKIAKMTIYEKRTSQGMKYAKINSVVIYYSKRILKAAMICWSFAFSGGVNKNELYRRK